MILSVLGIAESTASKKRRIGISDEGKYQTYIAETVVAFTPKMVVSYLISNGRWVGRG